MWHKTSSLLPIHASARVEYSIPFTCFTFTVDIVVTKKIVAIITSNFISWDHVFEYLDTGCVATSSYKLHVFTMMIITIHNTILLLKKLAQKRFMLGPLPIFRGKYSICAHVLLPFIGYACDDLCQKLEIIQYKSAE